MIPRYSLAPMSDLFSDDKRYQTWLEVELLVVEALAKVEVIPTKDAQAIRERASVDTLAIEAREEVTQHDVAAFVDVVQKRVGYPAGSWIHHGLTSSDVVDTALALTLVRACDQLLEAMGVLEKAIVRRAKEFRNTPMAGRTHGVHAEPTTFGRKLALWALQVRRDQKRLERARRTLAVGKLSGAVGTYSSIDPDVEALVCSELGLRPTPATQVIPRDRHAEFLFACASLGASIESFALEVRHLQRTEVREVEEPFRTNVHMGLLDGADDDDSMQLRLFGFRAQKGSSAMPHKRNPVKCEQLCGLARVLRANLQAGLENVALWHERDISHSSVERIVLADSANLAYYMAVTFTSIVDDMRVDAERMLANMDLSHRLMFSQPVLLALVEAGMARNDAYRVVQESAMRAWEENRDFLEVLRQDKKIRGVLPDARLERCFDLKEALAHADRAFDSLVEQAAPEE